VFGSPREHRGHRGRLRDRLIVIIAGLASRGSALHARGQSVNMVGKCRAVVDGLDPARGWRLAVFSCTFPNADSTERKSNRHRIGSSPHRKLSGAKAVKACVVQTIGGVSLILSAWSGAPRTHAPVCSSRSSRRGHPRLPAGAESRGAILRLTERDPRERHKITPAISAVHRAHAWDSGPLFPRMATRSQRFHGRQVRDWRRESRVSAVRERRRVHSGERAGKHPCASRSGRWNAAARSERSPWACHCVRHCVLSPGGDLSSSTWRNTNSSFGFRIRAATARTRSRGSCRPTVSTGGHWTRDLRFRRRTLVVHWWVRGRTSNRHRRHPGEANRATFTKPAPKRRTARVRLCLTSGLRSTAAHIRASVDHGRRRDLMATQR